MAKICPSGKNVLIPPISILLTCQGKGDQHVATSHNINLPTFLQVE